MKKDEEAWQEFQLTILVEACLGLLLPLLPRTAGRHLAMVRVILVAAIMSIGDYVDNEVMR